jgi:glyoxylase-like metal-dependent hydrolase (beta-lactamase superfamily II)
MYFRQILHEARACASYLVGCPTLGHCAVVDPQGDPRRYAAMAREHGMEITSIFETHIQADHLSSAQQLAELTGAAIYLGPGSGAEFSHHELEDRQSIAIGNRRITALHTPGHTRDHVCLLVDDWFLLTGDTLFVGDVGRVDLVAEEAAAEAVVPRAVALHRSLRRLLELPDWIEVYPGHYAGSVCGRGIDGKPISTIGRERRHNEALRLSPEEFVAFQTSNLPPIPEDFKAIKHANLEALSRR